MNKYTVIITMTSTGKCLAEVYDDTNGLLISTTLAKDFPIDEAFIEAQEVIEKDYMQKKGVR